MKSSKLYKTMVHYRSFHITSYFDFKPTRADVIKAIKSQYEFMPKDIMEGVLRQASIGFHSDSELIYSKSARRKNGTKATNRGAVRSRKVSSQ